MNRTGIFLAAASVLALTALIVGLPKAQRQPFNTIGQPVTPPAGPVSEPHVTDNGVTGDGALKLITRLSHPFVTPGSNDVFITADVTGVEIPGAKRAPVNLALVIDRSGSMSGYKLEQAKNAARQLVSQLDGDDRLAIVHYGSDVRVLPGMNAHREEKQQMMRFIDRIQDDGGTNIGAGLQAGKAQLVAAKNEFKVNRMILISDGQPTEGEQSQAGLANITRAVRRSGISVSTLGVGNDFNEDVMQAIAEIGSGAYGFLSDAAQLATLFQKDLNQAGTTVAQDVALTFELPPGTVLGDVLGYTVTTHGNRVRVSLPNFAAGQTERIVARLTVQAPSVGQGFNVSDVALEYQDLLKNSAVKTQAHVAAMVTDRVEEVAQKRDRDATVFAARALSAVNTRLAADAIKAGRKEEAEKLLEQNAAVFNQAAAVAGPSAVADDLRTQTALRDGFKNAEGDEAFSGLSKKAKSQARQDFGLMGSTY